MAVSERSTLSPKDTGTTLSFEDIRSFSLSEKPPSGPIKAAHLSFCFGKFDNFSKTLSLFLNLSLQ